MKTALLTLALAIPLASTAHQDPVKKDPAKPAPTSAAKDAVVVKAADVKWADHPSVPGAKMAVESGDPAKGPAVVLIKFPKGSTVPPHWHTANETVTVVSGSSVFGSGETADAAKGTELSSGSYIVIPSKSPHWAIIKEELVISVAMDQPSDFHLCSEKK
jgi:quercetin dioxygenase-like cupin family protein